MTCSMDKPLEQQESRKSCTELMLYVALFLEKQGINTICDKGLVQLQLQNFSQFFP